MTASVAAPDTETVDIVAVHDLPGQRVPRFTVSCGVPLTVVATADLPEARRLCRAGRGLARRASTAVASVHNPSLE
jgi:hypothetical protein